MKVRIGFFLNHILISGKQVIYSSRLSKSKTLFSQFIVKLKHKERIECYIAKREIGLLFMKRMENHKKIYF